MGMFDNALSFSPTNPGSMELMGALQGLTAAAMPSRLPVPMGAALGMAASGLQQGALEAQKYATLQQQLQTARLGYKGAQLDYALKSGILNPLLQQLGTAPTQTGVGAAAGGAPGSPALTNVRAPAGKGNVQIGAGAVPATSNVPGAAPTTPFDEWYSKFLEPEEGGYTANDGNGAPANYGINQGANPGVNVAKLTPAQAKAIAKTNYWDASGAHWMTPALGAIQADTAFNFGPQAAWQMLQQSGGDPQKYLALRAARYQQIAATDPTKAKFLPDWTKRNNDLAQYVAGFTPVAAPGQVQPVAGTPGAPQPQGVPSNASTVVPAGGAAPGLPASGLATTLGMRMLLGNQQRFQLMRNGWAYDNWTNSWRHFPNLGEGVTGTLGPNGNIHASVADGELPALQAIETAETIGSGKKLPPGYLPGPNGTAVPIATAPGTSTLPGTIPPNGLPPPAGVAASIPATGALPGGQASAAASAGATATTPAAQNKITFANPPVAGSGATPVSLGAPNIPPDLNTFFAVTHFKPAPTPNALQMEQSPAQESMWDELTKDDAERMQEYAKQQSEGQKIYTNVDQMYSIIQRGLNTGKMAPAATDLANLARQMGLGNLVPKGFDPNDANAFNKLATDLIFTSLKQLPGQPRVSEIEGLQRANPNISMTPEANVEILNNALAYQRWMDARANLAGQFIHQYPGQLTQFDSAFNKAYPEIDLYKAVANAAQKMGYKMPGSTPAVQLPPAALGQLKVGIVSHFRNGQSWTLGANGVPQQVQ